MRSVMREVKIMDASAKLYALIDQVKASDPAAITRHGRKEAVIISFEEYQRLCNVPSFGELLASFPVDDAIPERIRKPVRWAKSPLDL